MCKPSTSDYTDTVAVGPLYQGFLLPSILLQLSYLVVQSLAMWPGLLLSKHMPFLASWYLSVVCWPQVWYFIECFLAFVECPKCTEFSASRYGGPLFCAGATLGGSSSSDVWNSMALPVLHCSNCLCSRAGCCCAVSWVVVIQVGNVGTTES